MKTGIQINEDNRRSLSSMYSDLSQYKRRLRSYNSINRSLSHLKTKLESFNNYIKTLCSSIQDYDKNSLYLNKIDRHLITFNYVKDHLIPELYSYRGDFSALEQIGTKIHFLKIAQRKLKNDIDSNLSSSVKALQNISIKEAHIHTLILTMKNQFGYIIPELKLLKSLLQYRDSIAIILTWSEKLPLYVKSNVYEFLKISSAIIQTLRDSSKTIDSSISEFNKILDTIRTKDFYKRFHPELLDTSFRQQMSNFTTLLHRSTFDMKLIRHIIYNLQIIKSNSTKTIEEIKNKIGQISDLTSGLTKLKEIYYDINLFYYTHVKTTFFLNFYSRLLPPPKFANSLRRLNEIISETYQLIYFIKVYYIFLFHSNVIINNMEKLRPEVIVLDKFNNNISHIKELVSDIMDKLKVFKSNILKLESILSDITLNNLRDKIINYKYQIEVIRKIIDLLMKTLEHTREYIDKTVKKLEEKCKEITREIENITEYIQKMILAQEILSIPIYMKVKYYDDSIITVLSLIKKSLDGMKIIMRIDIKVINSNIDNLKGQIQKLKKGISDVKSFIDIIDGSFQELECAIEGVSRNLIRCSLLYLISYVETPGNPNVSV